MSEKGKTKKNNDTSESLPDPATVITCSDDVAKPLKKEINGPKGLEPTRYGDWESKGRCYDF